MTILRSSSQFLNTTESVGGMMTQQCNIVNCLCSQLHWHWHCTIHLSYVLQYWLIKSVVTFPSCFLDSRVGPSNIRYYLSCSPGSQDSKLVLHFSVALFLSILEQFYWNKKKILKQWKWINISVYWDFENKSFWSIE